MKALATSQPDDRKIPQVLQTCTMFEIMALFYAVLHWLRSSCVHIVFNILNWLASSMTLEDVGLRGGELQCFQNL